MSVTNLGEKNSAYAYVIIVNSLNIYIWFEKIRTYHSPLWWTKTSWSDWKKVYRWPVTRPDSDSDMTRARTWLGEWIQSPALASIRSISQTFSLDRGWFIRYELMSALQLFKHTKSTHPRLLPHFPPVIAEKEQNAATLSAKVIWHNVNTPFVLCCKFAYEIKFSERCQKN